MKWLIPLIFLLLPGMTFCQREKEPVRSSFTGGMEVDALPFITGGYYLSVWGGYRHFRYRIVLTEVNTPSFLVPKDFANNQVEVYAFVTDYFFKREFKGFWIGTGIEWWKGEITTHDNSAKGTYDNYVYTIGGGYVWKFYRNFYLNPWLGGHLRIGGDTRAQTGDQVFHPRLFTPEVSIKLGWHF